jgi:hypothetical protein
MACPQWQQQLAAMQCIAMGVSTADCRKGVAAAENCNSHDASTATGHHGSSGM